MEILGLVIRMVALALHTLAIREAAMHWASCSLLDSSLVVLLKMEAREESNGS